MTSLLTRVSALARSTPRVPTPVSLFPPAPLSTLSSRASNPSGLGDASGPAAFDNILVLLLLLRLLLSSSSPSTPSTPLSAFFEFPDNNRSQHQSRFEQLMIKRFFSSSLRDPIEGRFFQNHQNHHPSFASSSSSSKRERKKRLSSSLRRQRLFTLYPLLLRWVTV